jgi:DNA transformation protein
MAYEELVRHSLELLQPLGSVRSRRMFGGHGLYVDDLFIALIAYDTLFLKTDAHTRPAFEAAGCEPFVYEAAGNRQVSVSYFTVPPDAMESPALMQPWARMALDAALRARAAKRPAARRKAAPTGSGQGASPSQATAKRSNSATSRGRPGRGSA